MSFGIQPFSTNGFSSIGETEFVDVTTVVGTGAVGSVSIDLSTRALVTGLAGTGAVGSATVAFGSSVSVTGLAGTGSVGSVTTSFTAVIFPTGVSGTGHIADDETVNVWANMVPSTTTTWIEIAA
jgi:hypothetical protein